MELVFANDIVVAEIDWSEYFDIIDNVDGEMPFDDVWFDIDWLDTTQVGSFDQWIGIWVEDSFGNLPIDVDEWGYYWYTVNVFDPNDTTPPTLIANAGDKSFKVDTDVSTIVWANYIDTAQDVSGYDITHLITPDISALDTTQVGTVTVPITLTDYAGNETTIDVEFGITE